MTAMAIDPDARGALVSVEARVTSIESNMRTLEANIRNTLAATEQSIQAMTANIAAMQQSMQGLRTDVAQQQLLQAQQSAQLLQAQQPTGNMPSSPPGMQPTSSPPNVSHMPDTNHPPRNGDNRKIVYTPKSDLAELPQFDGNVETSDGDLWYRKIRNHLIAQHKDLKAFLDWAEAKGAKRIDMSEVRSYNGMLDLDPMTLATEIWGFLNANLKGEAHNGFLGVEETNGAEAWRKVVHSINGKTAVRRLALKRGVDAPNGAQDMAEVMQKIERWEEHVRKYVRAGGREPDDEEKMATLLHIVPPTEQVALIRQDFLDYEEMREHVRGQSELLQHLGLHKKRGALHACSTQSCPPHVTSTPSFSALTGCSISPPPPPHVPIQNQESSNYADYEDLSREDLMAIVKGKGKGKNPNIVCFGCGERGHPQRLCPYGDRKGKGKGKTVMAAWGTTAPGVNLVLGRAEERIQTSSVFPAARRVIRRDCARCTRAKEAHMLSMMMWTAQR